MVDLEKLATEQAMATEADQMGLNVSETPNSSVSANIAQPASSQGFLDGSIVNTLDFPPVAFDEAEKWTPQPQRYIAPSWRPSYDAGRDNDLSIKETIAQTQAFKTEDESFEPEEITRRLMMEQTIQKGMTNLLTSYDVPVEVRLRAAEIGKELGISENLVIEDMPTYERKYALRKAYITASDNPSLAAFLSDPKYARLAKDDIDKLGYLDSVVQGIGDAPSEALQYSSKSIEAFNNIGKRLPPPRMPGGVKNDNWTYSIAKGATSLAVGFGESAFKGGLPLGVMGAAAGLAGTPVGSAIGGVTGFGAGVATHQALQGTGEAYSRAYWSVYDGLVSRGVSSGEAERQAMENAISSIGFNFPVEFAANYLPASRIAGRAIAPLADRAIGGLAGKVATSAGMGAVESALQEGISEATKATSVEYAKNLADMQNIFKDATPEQWEEYLSGIGTNALYGLFAGGAISGGGTLGGHIAARYTREAPTALHQEQVLSDIVDASGATKTAGRDLETLKAFLQTSLAGTDGETAHIPIEKVQEMAMQYPEAFAKIAESVPDLAQQLQIASDTGADISLPTASILAFMQQDAKAFIADMKLSPDGMSGNEAREAMGELDAGTKAELDKIVQSIAEPQTKDPAVVSEELNKKSIRRTILDELKNVPNITNEQKQAYAQWRLSRLEARVKASDGMYSGVMDVYQRDPFTLQGGDEFKAESQAREAVEKKGKKKENRAILSAPAPQESVILDAAPVKPVFTGRTIGEGQIKIGNEYVPTQVMVVDADALSPTLEPAPNQPRNRDRAASEIQIEGYANNLDPNYLTANFPDMVNGTPTLAPDGTILGGNGRAESIKRAYQRGTADAYRAMVTAEAKKAKINISKMKNPVLVRTLKNNVDIERTARLSNQSTQAVYSAMEQAAKDSLLLGDIKAFEFNANGDLSRTGNEQALRQFTSQLPKEELGRFIDSEGHLSAEGKTRIQSAILHRAYGDSPLLSRMIEDTSPEGRNINAAMARIAPEVARIEEAMARGELYNLPLRDDLLQAIDKYIDLRRKDQTVEDYQKQTNLLGDDLTSEGKVFLQTISDNVRSAKRLGDVLSDSYKKIESFGDPRVEDMFGDRPIPTKQDILPVLKEQPRSFQQGARGQVIIADNLKIIQIFKSGDFSTLIHEDGGHAFLEEFIYDATNAPEGTAPQLKEDFQATKDWWKELADSGELYDMHTKKNIFGTKGAERKAELAMLQEMKAEGYVQAFIDGGMKNTDAKGEYAYKLLHEMFARGAERYVMEGKAPNASLARVFQKFVQWMKQIYQSLEELNAPISDEMRAVFSRLIAAEQMTEQVGRDLSIEPLFPNQEASGMGKAEYEQYRKNIEQQNNETLQKTIQKQMSGLREERTKEGKQFIESEIKRLDKTSKAERHIQTYNRLMGLDENGKQVGGALKINPKTFIELYPNGKQQIKFLPKEIFDKEGMDYKLAKETMGYENLREFTDDLALVEQMRANVSMGKKMTIEEARQKSIERQAKTNMRERLSPENLREDVIENFHLAGFEKSLADELNALSKTLQKETGEADLSGIDPNLLAEYMRHNIVAKMQLKDLARRSKTYLNAERRAANKAQKHLMKSDYRSAYAAKREQLVSHILYKKSLQAQNMQRKADRLFKRIAKNKTIKGIDRDTMAILHRVLQDQGMETARSSRESREGYFEPELEKYFTDEDGNPVDIKQAFDIFLQKNDMNTAFIADFVRNGTPSNGTIQDFRDLYHTVASIFHHGKAQEELYLAGKKADFKETVTSIVATGRDGRKLVKPRNQATQNSMGKWESVWNTVRGGVGRFFASMTKANTIFNRLDRYKDDGHFSQLFSELHNGMSRFDDYMKGFKNSMEGFKRSLGKNATKYFNDLNNTLTKNELLGDHVDDGLLKISRRDMIGLALHRGAPDNFRKLIRGRETREDGTLTGWTAENVDAFLTANMTKTDWDFVRMLWQEAGKNWVDLEATQKRLNGFAPDKVVTQTIDTPFGQIEGGYWPLNYEETVDLSSGTAQFGEDRSFGDNLKASGGINRVDNVKKPVTLDFMRGIRHAEQTAYATHLVEPYRDLRKVLKNTSVSRMIKEVMGENQYNSLTDLLKTIESPNRHNVGMMDYVMTWGNRMQAGVMLTNFAYAIKPFMDAMSDVVAIPFNRGMSVLGYSKEAIRLTMMGAYNTFAQNGKSEWEWARQFDAVKAADETTVQSKKAFDEAVNARWGKTQKAVQTARAFAWEILEVFSRTTATVVARASHDLYVAKYPNATPEQISNFVNKSVRENHIARNFLDTPLVQRNRINQNLKIFLSFPLKALNNFMELFYEAKDIALNPTQEQKAMGGFKRGKIAATNMIKGVIGLAIPQLSYMFWTGEIPKDEDGENDYLKALLISPAYAFLSSFPIIRDLSDIVFKDNSYFAGSGDMRFRDLEQAIKDAKRVMASDHEYGKREAHTLLRLFGEIAGVPTKPITALEYITRQATGDQQTTEEFSLENLPATIKDIQRGY